MEEMKVLLRGRNQSFQQFIIYKYVVHNIQRFK